MRELLIGLVPALMWGIAPPLMTRFVEGGAFIQMLGTMIGVTLVAIVFAIARGIVMLAPAVAIIAFVSGAMWPIGMYGQFASNMKIGVSRTFPISSGLQIAGNALIGWLVLGEWKTGRQISLGLLSICLILGGIMICNVVREKTANVPAQEGSSDSNGGSGSHTGSGSGAGSDKSIYILLIATTAGYWLYALMPKYIPDADSNTVFLLQGLGMLTSAICITRFAGKQKLTQLDGRDLCRSSVIGLLYGVAAIAFLISLRENGLVRGNLLGQLNLIIATLIGMYVLKEKQKVSPVRTWLGIALILGGVVIIQFV